MNVAGSAEPTFAGDFPPVSDQEWRESVEKVLRGAPFSELVSRTADGIEVQPLYTDGPDDSVTGGPGEAPFTRGFSAIARESGSWDVRSSICGSDVDLDNRHALAELERGATSLLIGGAALGDEASLAKVLDGVLLDLAPVVVAPGAAFASAAEWLMRLWADRGVADRDALGGFGADPLGTLASTGLLPQGAARALADAAGLAAMAAKRYPKVRALSIDATVYAESGASEAIELAAMLSTGVAYLRAMSDAGIDAADAGAQIEVVLGADPDFFTTIAKLRAARQVFSAMAEACGVDVAGSPPSITVRTLDRAMSRRDPWVNLLRVTSGAFAAVLGGADSVITTAFDAELGEPSELARRMARNTQLLLGEESGIGRVMDPAGGSWFVETLTSQLAEEAWRLFRVLEGAGGMPEVLLDGTLGAGIARVRDDRFAEVATRRAPITGVSEFPSLHEQPPDVLGHGERTVAAVTPDGTPTRCEPLPRIRWAQEFEALRDAADSAREAGDAPLVFLANMGPVATHTARASWARNFFEAGGIEAVTSQRGDATGFDDPAEVAADFADSAATIACLCSSDEQYAARGAAFAEALGSADAVYLAGRPGEGGDELRAAGVDHFVHVGVDVLAMLREAHRVLGIEAVEDRR